MSSRQTILEAVHKHRGAAVPLPAITGSWTTFLDKARHFETMLAAVGGVAVGVPTIEACRQHLLSWPAWNSAQKTLSTATDVAIGSIQDGDAPDPHELRSLDFVLLQGEFGVAENAAVWIDASNLKHRVAPFITQHLGIVLDIHQIVDHMHQAYERLSFEKKGFGVFISGPSKTADIEQSLVIGAHGARTHIVYLVG